MLLFSFQELEKKSLRCVDGVKYIDHQVVEIHCRDIQQDIQVDVFGKCDMMFNEEKKSVPFVDSFLLKSAITGFYVDKHLRHTGPNTSLPRELAQIRASENLAHHDNSAVIKVQSLWRRGKAVKDAKLRRQAIVKLQSWVKTVSMKRKQREADAISHLRKISAARCLQRYFHKRREERKAKLIQAIVFVQSRYRMVKTLKEAKSRRDAIATIAAAFKAILQIKEAKQRAQTNANQSRSHSRPKFSTPRCIKSIVGKFKKMMRCCFTAACVETKHES